VKNQKKYTLERITIFRKELRSNLTPAEAFFANWLKARKFEEAILQKQHSIWETIIVDFIAASEKIKYLN